MNNIDRIQMTLDAGETITGLVRDNGWKYKNVQSIQETNSPGVYRVVYLYDGEPLGVILAGSEIANVEIASRG